MHCVLSALGCPLDRAGPGTVVITRERTVDILYVFLYISEMLCEGPSIYRSGKRNAVNYYHDLMLVS